MKAWQGALFQMDKLAGAKASSRGGRSSVLVKLLWRRKWVALSWGGQAG